MTVQRFSAAVAPLQTFLEDPPLSLQRARWAALGDRDDPDVGAGELAVSAGRVYFLEISGGGSAAGESNAFHEIEKEIAVVIMEPLDEARIDTQEAELTDFAEDVRRVLWDRTGADVFDVGEPETTFADEGDAWLVVVPLSLRYEFSITAD